MPAASAAALNASGAHLAWVASEALDLRAPPPTARAAVGIAFGAALTLELAVLGAGLWWLAGHPQPAPLAPVPLMLEVLAEPAQDKPQRPIPAGPSVPVSAPMPVPQPPKRMAPTPPRQIASEAPSNRLPEILPIAPAVAETTAPADARPLATAGVPTRPPTAVATPSAPSVDPSPAYYRKLNAAAQAAFELPAAAEALGFKGRALVEFTLRDGVASGVRLLQGSGLGAVDRAALRAIQSAAFPAPPVELQGKDGIYQIWVVCS